MTVRVQKIIAEAGLCSRRKAEELIEDGRVTVNGVKITIGDKADPKTDRIMVNDQQVYIEDKVSYMLNKPKNYITTSDDMYKRNIVLELVPKKPRVFAVGRLDRYATGFLVLTNDGDFAQSIAHPSKEISKTYIAILDQPFNIKHIESAKNGIVLDDKKVTAAIVQLDKITIAVTLHVGIHKVVKRMLKEMGYYVKSLHRTHIGNLALDVEDGQHRPLTKDDVKKIFEKPNITKETFLEE